MLHRTAYTRVSSTFYFQLFNSKLNYALSHIINLMEFTVFTCLEFTTEIPHSMQVALTADSLQAKRNWVEVAELWPLLILSLCPDCWYILDVICRAQKVQPGQLPTQPSKTSSCCWCQASSICVLAISKELPAIITRKTQTQCSLI